MTTLTDQIARLHDIAQLRTQVDTALDQAATALAQMKQVRETIAKDVELDAAPQAEDLKRADVLIVEAGAQMAVALKQV